MAMKKTSIAAVLMLATCTSSAATFEFIGTFDMYSGLTRIGGSSPPGANDVTGTFDFDFATGTGAGGTMTSTSAFFGFLWTAHDLVMTATPGGTVVADIPFDWGAPTTLTPCGVANCDIPVVVEFIMAPSATPGVFDVTTVDSDGNGAPGQPMTSGPFIGFSPAFSGKATAQEFTPPEDIIITENTVTQTPALAYPVPIGTVSDAIAPQYSLDQATWINDNGTGNTINVDLVQTTTTLTVYWRDSGGTGTILTQSVTVTIDDVVAPNFTSIPAPAVETWPNTAVPVEVCFGAADAADAIEPNLLIEWAINVEADWQEADSTDNCSTNFNLNENTVYWRATDVGGNSTTVTQTVTLNLPDGIIGTECVIDLETAKVRLVDGRFIMRDVTAANVGAVDETVTGSIDTTLVCPDESCTDVGAALETDQTFFGFTWEATPIRLFGEGTWTFETCLDDGSTACVAPTPVSMTVGPDQLGAHMLFNWSVNANIDVVVVWDVGCGKFQLTTTDPDGDGILGTPMFDGPFKGFNAAFDVNTIEGEPPIADGGYQSIVPVFKNPVDGESPLPITIIDDNPVVSEDTEAVRSCVGRCNDFTVEADGMIDGDGYQFAQVVIPLTGDATSFYSVYRKYDPNTGLWGPFVIDDHNNVQTAPMSALNGACPEPGDGAYDRPLTGILEDKLRADDECVQLNIKDNGSNDLDDTVGVIRYTGGVAEMPEPPLADPNTSGDTIDIGGCTISGTPIAPHERLDWWLLGGLLAWLGISVSHKRRQRLQ